MEQYIDIATRFWNEFSSWSPSPVTLYTMLGFGVLSAWMMVRVSAAAPLFAGPISFIVLTFAAMVSNFAMRGLPMMGTTDLQKAIMFTALGHVVAALLLIVVLRTNVRR